MDLAQRLPIDQEHTTPATSSCGKADTLTRCRAGEQASAGAEPV